MSKMGELSGDEIIISGVSGLFPDAKNVNEFSEKLYNKIDMVSKLNKYPNFKNPEFPQYLGEFEGIENFDCQFFRVTSKQAKCMDPVMGKLLEQTFSALFDAGVNPETVSQNMGVYMACAQIDSTNFMFSDIKGSSSVISGGSKCMLANRISYWLDAKGPSYSSDCGYAGSMGALEIAYNAMKKGEIDCAIVGGCNYCFKPELTLNMKRAELLCLDGKTKCFDKNGDGFVRSNAVNVFFLQKAKDAKRIYAEISYVKGKFFASTDGMFTLKRNPRDIEQFLKEFYSEVYVDPNDVEYLEANSTGIAEADGNELEAVGNIFANNRTVKIGSIKSNMGNTECASGASSIIKLCLAYHKGEIPANLHFKQPQNNITAVREERLQVVTKNEQFSRGFAAINNFCFTGNNFHALLKGHYKSKDKERYKTTIPRLVLVASREEEGVNKMLNLLESNPIDPEQLALLNNFFKHNISGFTGRGYTLLDTDEYNKTFSLCRSFEYYSGSTRPIWFLYSGMGSQWAGMGKDLLKFPVFAAAIQRCANILEKKGLDLIDIITNQDSKQLNILKSLMAITSIQIGLTDVLKSVGIMPDNILGHSVGEIASAYGDGCLTADEAILTSYARAIATYETKFIKGTMAAVGLGYKDVIHLCPPEVEVACHNSSESSTIAGPREAASLFVKSLTDRGVFAKEVDSYDIAFHSRYIIEAGPKMLKLLQEVITDPKPRSNKWLSTCYLPENWHKLESQYASAEYFTHNLMSSVLLEEAATLIPEDAIIIEIAPHGLLQAIMKRSHSECTNIPLTKRGETDGAKFLLNSLGKLYQSGLNLDLEQLYPKVEFPVSTETSLLSHFVQWSKQTHWKFDTICQETKTSITQEIIFSVHDDEFQFLKGSKLHEVNRIPEAAILVFTWETLATFNEKTLKNTSVIFENITFHDQIFVDIDEIVRFDITIQRVSNKFEVLHKNKLVADGIIYLVVKSIKQLVEIEFNKHERQLTKKDVYSLLRIRGFNYDGEFKSIMSMNINKNKASVKWSEEWITFLDSIIQIKTLFEDHEGLTRVKYINKLTIDTFKHKYTSANTNDDKCYNAKLSDDTGIIVCGGVTFNDIILDAISKIETVSFAQNDTKIDKVMRDSTKTTSISNGINELKSFKLIAKQKNNTSNLIWIKVPVNTTLGTVQIHYAGLSLKDCERLDRPDNQSFGMDFSGVDENGRSVMGLVPCGAMASTVEADSDLLWPVPQHWSLTEAATVPLPYVHAFYCLAIKHTLSKNDTILVVGAAGGLGQAVISIALHFKCTVFATVGNADKKKFILKLFPELDGNKFSQLFSEQSAHLLYVKKNVGYSCDQSFRTMVAKNTNKTMCNIVINTSSGNIREEAMKCVVDRIFNNAFLDVNNNDQTENKVFRMGFSNGAKSYKSVNVSTIFHSKFKNDKKKLQIMISEGIAKGYVRPLTSVVYSPWEVSRAYKLMSQRNNIGRALICLERFTSIANNMTQTPRMTIQPNKAYIVVFDGSELGIEIINLLIQREAKHILIHCNPNAISGYFLARHEMWKKRGININYYCDDLLVEYNCQNFVNVAMKLGDVDGIFMTWSKFDSSQNIKQHFMDSAKIVSNLDEKIRVCTGLRFFAVITAGSKTGKYYHGFNELQKCCYRRMELGLPSLHLHHVLGGKAWYLKPLLLLFNELEKCLTENIVSMSTSSEEYDNNMTLVREKYNTSFGASFKAFYRDVSQNELEATEPIVSLKSKLSLKNENNLAFDPENEYIIMIPGFESYGKTLANVAERLKKPAIALQADVHSSDDISTIARRLYHHVKMRCHLKSPFHLVGYSFGINIALEFAAMLETEGLVGVVYCIDSSPDNLRDQLDAYLGNITEEQLQTALIEHIYKLLGGYKSNELSTSLAQAATWSEKIEIFLNIAKTEVQNSLEYLRSLLEGFYIKIKLSKRYKPKFVLNSQLVLLKGIPHPDIRNLSNDYNLSVYTKKPVQVFDIKSDHAMALDDCRICNIINRNLIVDV